MKFLHTCWCDNALYVWAEQDVDCADLLSGSGKEPVYSPFNVKAQALKNLLQSLKWVGRKGVNPETFEISLPSVTHNKCIIPIPSHSFLIRNSGKTDLHLNKKVTYKKWYVDAIKLTKRQVIALFGICQKKRVAPGIFLDNDVFAMKNLYRFAGALITRSSFLPSVVQNGDNEYNALWNPVLTLVDEKRFKQIK
jgi:hypothetical protein